LLDTQVTTYKLLFTDEKIKHREKNLQAQRDRERNNKNKHMHRTRKSYIFEQQNNTILVQLRAEQQPTTKA